LPVEIKGLAETLTAMRKFEPDLAKNLNKEVRALLTPVQKNAQAYVPTENPIPHLRNWMLGSSKQKVSKETSMFRRGTFPKFNAALVRRGIKIYIGKTVPNNRGFVTFYRIENQTAAGAIMETSGRANGKSRRVYSSNNPEAGIAFRSAMGGQLKGHDKLRGRLIYRAYEEDQGKTTARLVKAVEKTVVQFKQRANAQVFRNAA